MGHVIDLKGFDKLEVKDVVHCSNFSTLEVAANQYTTSEIGMKATLKVRIMYYLLKNRAKVVNSTYFMSGKDAAAVEVDHFVEVLTLNYNYFLCGDAIYHVNQNCELKLQKPEQVPTHADVL